MIVVATVGSAYTRDDGYTVKWSVLNDIGKF